MRIVRRTFLSTCMLAAAAARGAGMETNNTLTADEEAQGWKPLFDGRSLGGWQASDAPGTFSVKDGELVAAARVRTCSTRARSRTTGSRTSS